MDEELLSPYLELSQEDIRRQLLAIQTRNVPQQGRRQEPFLPVEIVLCYGLFSLVNPHRYGGSNSHTAPSIVHVLAAFFRRSSGSVLSKMLNLDGSRQHGKREEPLLFAHFAADSSRYRAIYTTIVQAARELHISEQIFPDFLCELFADTHVESLLGQDDLPESTSVLLADAEHELKNIDQTFTLGDQLTEKLVERKIRLSQHHFARAVLTNCARTCVFCGFEPRLLPDRSGLLRASHIKPWAVSNASERVDVRNGVAACPIHDAAFDLGYLTIDDSYAILLSDPLRRSITTDHKVGFYFEEAMHATIQLPLQATRPGTKYLLYHQQHIFKGGTYRPSSIL